VAATFRSVDGVCLLQSMGFLERRKVTDATSRVDASSADDLLYLAEVAERQEQAELDHIDDLLRGVDDDTSYRNPVDADSLLRSLEEQAEESDADLLRRALQKRMKSKEAEEDDSRRLLREVLSAVDNSPREAHLGDRHMAELLRALRDHGVEESKPRLSQRRLDDLARALQSRDARERPMKLGRDTLQQLLGSLRGDSSRASGDVQEFDSILRPQSSDGATQSNEDRLLQASVAVAEAAAKGEQAAVAQLDRLKAQASVTPAPSAPLKPQHAAPRHAAKPKPQKTPVALVSKPVQKPDLDDSCNFSKDGSCDEPSGLCAVGTDCSDCGACSTSHTAASSVLLQPDPTDSCEYANDGDCDEPLVCRKGTDCSDCGTCPGAAKEAAHKQARMLGLLQEQATPSKQQANPALDDAGTEAAESGEKQQNESDAEGEQEESSASVLQKEPKERPVAPLVRLPLQLPQEQEEVVLDDSCGTANDSVCDEPQECSKGTDCTDCGTCVPQDGPWLEPVLMQVSAPEKKPAVPKANAGDALKQKQAALAAKEQELRAKEAIQQKRKQVLGKMASLAQMAKTQIPEAPLAQ